MKKSVRARILTVKSRLKRRAGYISREVLGSAMLIAAIFLIGSALIYGSNVVLSSPYFWIKETVIRGCKEVTEKDVLTLAALRSPQSILSVNVNVMSNKIKENPWIKDVVIGRELPDRLVIEIREKKAMAVIKKDEGFFLMDNEGNPIKKVETADEADLPVLTGYKGETKENLQLLKKTMDLLQYAAASKTFPQTSNISEVHNNDALGISVFTDKGICLHLGFDGFESKLARLSAVIADLEAKNLKLAYSNIDLSDPEKVTVKWKNLSIAAEASESKKGHKI
jgi:cell division protein FtsQ